MKKESLKTKFQGIQLIRNWFLKEKFMDVMTPSIVQCPGIEPHLQPFEVIGKNHRGYLQTSPEFHMKELLSYGLNNIFTLTYSFRDEPNSETHRPQFIMLEWYRANAHYEKIKNDSKNLIDYLIQELEEADNKFKTTWEEWTIKEAFLKFTHIDLDKNLSLPNFYSEVSQKFSHLPLPELDEITWDDLFFIVFLNVIEPQLKEFPKVILTEYPASQAALATLKPNDPTVCERFEIYLDGIEIGNCFNELTNLSEQQKRYQAAKSESKALYGKNIPEPTVLFDALSRGLPKSAGIAVGVERLISTIVGNHKIFID